MSENDISRIADTLERIGKVLGALYASHLDDLDIGVKAKKLTGCGFTNSETADILGTTPNHINVALHRAKSKAGKTKKAK